MMSLEGKVAIVTGGSFGMGLAAVQALAGAGCSVVSMARDPSRLDASVAALEPERRARVTGMAGDVREEEDVRSTVERVIGQFGRIDILINSAGVSMRDREPLQATRTEDWRRILETNLTGTYLMCRETLPHMQAADSGYIVNILSTGAYRSGAGSSLYAASKFGARALTEALIDENRRSGVRISSVSPGPVNTNIWTHKKNDVTPEDRATMLQADDIADIILYLLRLPDNVHIENVTVTPWKR